MFFLTRVKGVYTFDDADSKRKIDYRLRSILKG